MWAFWGMVGVVVVVSLASCFLLNSLIPIAYTITLDPYDDWMNASDGDLDRMKSSYIPKTSPTICPQKNLLAAGTAAAISTIAVQPLGTKNEHSPISYLGNRCS